MKKEETSFGSCSEQIVCKFLSKNKRKMVKTNQSTEAAVLNDNYSSIAPPCTYNGTDVKLEEVFIKEEILMSESEIRLDLQPFSIEQKDFNKINSMDEEQLINVVQKFSEVYDDKHMNYHNKMRQAYIWKEIGKEMGKPVTECRKRWCSLIDWYRKLPKCKVVRGKNTTKKKKLCNLELQMEFMRPFISNQPVINSEGMASDIEEIDNSIETNPNSVGSKNLKSPSSAVQISNSAMENMSMKKHSQATAEGFSNDHNRTKSDRHILDMTSRPKDHLTKFCEYIEETVRTFPPHLQIDLKTKIVNIVHEAEKSNINFQSSVSSSNNEFTLDNSTLQPLEILSSNINMPAMNTSTRNKFVSNNSTHQPLQTPSILSNLDFQTLGSISKNQCTPDIPTHQSSQAPLMYLHSQCPKKKSNDVVCDTNSINIEDEIFLGDPSTTSQVINPERLKRFKISFAKYLKLEHKQAVLVNDFTKYLNRINVDNEFSKSEVDAALQALTDSNQIMVGGDTIFLI